jgi:hypothetical protein
MSAGTECREMVPLAQHSRPGVDAADLRGLNKVIEANTSSPRSLVEIAAGVKDDNFVHTTVCTGSARCT